MSICAILVVVQSFIPSATSQVTIVADFPHLLIDKLDNVDKKEETAENAAAPTHAMNVAAMMDAAKMFALLTKPTAKDKEDPDAPLEVVSALGNAMRVAKADPPPTGLVLDRLAEAVAKTIQDMRTLSPKDQEAPNPDKIQVKLLVLVAYRESGWCDITLNEQAISVEGNSAFAHLAPLAYGLNLQNAAAQTGLMRLVKQRAGNNKPFMSDYVVAFDYAHEPTDSTVQSKKLKEWWASRKEVLHRLIDEKYLGTNDMGKRLTIDVDVYEAVQIQNFANKPQSAKSDRYTVWMSQSAFREEWQGGDENGLLNGKGMPKNNDLINKTAQALITKGTGAVSLANTLKAYTAAGQVAGSWPTVEHRKEFCAKTAKGKGMGEFIKMMQHAIPVRSSESVKPINQRNLEAPFPASLSSIKCLSACDTHSEYESWVDRVRNSRTIKQLGATESLVSEEMQVDSKSTSTAQAR